MKLITKKTKKQKQNLLFLILFFLIISIKFQFFLNIYLILKNNTESRMVSNYGYCYPLGYGFIKYVYAKYNLDEHNINTNNKNIAPTSSIFKFSFGNKISVYEILINHKASDLKKIKKKFNIVESNGNCHLVKYLND